MTTWTVTDSTGYHAVTDGVVRVYVHNDGFCTCSEGCPFVIERDDAVSHIEWHQTERKIENGQEN